MALLKAPRATAADLVVRYVWRRIEGLRAPPLACGDIAELGCISHVGLF